MKRTPEYLAWRNMRTRCFNPRIQQWADYGGRGITVCERWLTFENFYADMGLRPSPRHSLDRLDNDGNYEPGNVRWATREEQQQNRSDNVLTLDLVREIRASTESPNRIARRLGLYPSAVYRARNGETWANVQ